MINYLKDIKKQSKMQMKMKNANGNMKQSLEIQKMASRSQKVFFLYFQD